ncbi:hypothetical protein KCP69_05160 [Salmonella enterica subsp. enterica]|nr:hypothetical protein KCP69_05160 [Salmonella enterica subsp. enterica]
MTSPEPHGLSYSGAAGSADRNLARFQGWRCAPDQRRHDACSRMASSPALMYSDNKLAVRDPQFHIRQIVVY